MKKIVIIGGGFAGTAVARHLEKENFRVILIDNKNYFEYCPGILKTIIEPSYIRNIHAHHKDYLKKTEFVLGEVKEVFQGKVKVNHLGKQREISFDYLVISSGSNYRTIKADNVTSVGRAKDLLKSYEKLKVAKYVLVVGGGIVGVELAAEIITKYPNKKLTIVHSKDELIERAPKKAREYTKKFFTERGVEIIFNDHVNPEGKVLKLDSGKEINADIVFPCIGIKTNFYFMKKNFSKLIDERDQIKVNKYLQVNSNIFACGDVCSIREEKTAQNSEIHGELIAKNIINLEKKKALIEYKSEPRTMVISLGKWNGIIVTKREMVLKGFIPAILKKIIELKTMRNFR